MATLNVPSLEAGRGQSVCRLGYGLEGRSFETRQQQEIFLFSKTSRPTLGPTQLIFNGHRGSLPRLKRSGLEVAHSLLSTVLWTAGVMNLASVALCRHRDSKFHEWTASCGDHLPFIWSHCKNIVAECCLCPKFQFRFAALPASLAFSYFRSGS
jgi:hypothetical protein